MKGTAPAGAGRRADAGVGAGRGRRGAAARAGADPGAALEWLLVLLGLAALLFLVPHRITSDGRVRFEALSDLLTGAQLSDMGYSMVGPVFSAPLWLLGRAWGSPESWCARYNFILFAGGLAGAWALLRGLVPGALVRRFLLLLVLASMFPRYQADYFGEMFTAVMVMVGVLLLVRRRAGRGMACLVLGTANQPACMVGLLFVAAAQVVREKRWRYLLAPLSAALLVGAEAWIRRGSPFVTGYEGDAGVQTVLPFSGRPGFSYPFVFGVLSILFSFGKGLFLFAPGLLLPVRDRLGAAGRSVARAHRLWLYFVAGMVLVYAKWWAWYGGWYWGPRFFLVASVPASLALAANLVRPRRSFLAGLLLMAVLAWSFWVGVNGILFDQEHLEACTADNYALESLAWYVPEFSVLFRPFVVADRPGPGEALILLYWLAVCLYLLVPLAGSAASAAASWWGRFARAHLRRRLWRF